METFEQFVAAINSHDPETLGRLMATDHLFIDGLGNRVQGRVAMKAGWSNYFALCSDYWLRVDTCLERNGTVLAVGEAGGTIDGQTWKIPAAWKAMIREGMVSEWRVFADNKPVYEILEKRKAIPSTSQKTYVIVVLRALSMGSGHASPRVCPLFRSVQTR